MKFLESIIHQSRKNPNGFAIICNDDYVSYNTLILEAVDISTQVKNIIGIKKICAILSNKSIDLIRTMLACFLSNNIYMPVNVQAPVRRNINIIRVSMAQYIIVLDICAELIQLLKNDDLIYFITLNKKIYHKLKFDLKISNVININIGHGSINRLEKLNISGDDIAYIMFTSGSTGSPKGVPISYNNLQNYIDNIFSKFEIKNNLRHLQLCDIAFDLSMHEIMISLVSGGSLYIFNELSGLNIFIYIQKYAINYLMLLPSSISIFQYSQQLFDSKLQSVRTVFFCGETLLLTTIDIAANIFSLASIINLYGPTECTIACTYHIYNSENNYSGLASVPIGQAFDKVDLSIDANGQLTIAGEQSFNGYLNMPGKIQNHISGDIVFSHTDYGLVCMGRKDDQWKIQGYRLEKNEVEKSLRDIFSDEEIYAISVRDNKNIITGIAIIFSNEHDLFLKENKIKKCLPKVILPLKYYVIHDIPRHANGKVNYLQLETLVKDK